MKKGLVFAALISTVMVCLCGCSVGFIGGSKVRYDNADKYTAGDREITEKIDKLDIDWVSGKVTVTADDVSTVTVKETTKGDLEDKIKVHTWAEGSTLHVRFCKSGERYSEKEMKTLEITVPEDVLYKSVKVDSASADVVCEGLNSKKAVMDASSGDMVYNGDAESFTADTSSGNIGFSGKAKNISTDSSSGDVFIEQKGEGESISSDTSSGDVEITAENAGSVSVDSSSGEQTIRLEAAPNELSLDSSSGDIKVYLPEDADFTANIDTASGDVDYELPMSKKGDETYVCGNGDGEYRIDTASGDVKIYKN